MSIEQEIRAQIEKNKGLKLAVGEINNHLSILEGLLRNGRDDAQKQVDEAYQRGLDDAWEAARKIFGYEMDGGIPINELGGVFGYAEDAIFCTADIIRHNSASEAIAKLKSYEEKQKADELKVGDEVMLNNGTKTYIVVSFGENTACGFTSDGIWTGWELNKITKTGRHFNIDKILEEMKE